MQAVSLQNRLSGGGLFIGPAPAAIRDFGSKIPDPVGAKNPLLAENRIVPVDPPTDVRSASPDVSSRSFDSLPSRQVTTSRKANQSKGVTLTGEAVEAVNFLNMMTLHILP